MEDFEIEIKSAFLDEAKILLEESEEFYMNLESNAEDFSVLDAIFRNAHSLKGGSKGAGFKDIESLTHSLEGLLFKIKERQEPVTAALVSLLLRVNDTLRQHVQLLREDLLVTFDPSEFIYKLENYSGTESENQVSHTEHENSFNPYSHDHAENSDEDTFTAADIPPSVSNSFDNRFDEGQFNDDIIADENDGTENNEQNQQSPSPPEETGFHLFADDDVVVQEPKAIEAPKNNVTKLPVAKKVEKDGDDGDENKKGHHDEQIKVSLKKIESLINSVGEMVILQSVLSEEAKKIKTAILSKTVNEVGKIVKEVQDVSMGLRMVPIKHVFKKMQRIVRDSALDLGKKVNFNVEGEEVEVDKTVLDQISDPLVHLTRNAIDHGVESPEDRIKANKSECGEVTLRAYHESGRLIISMIDDGKGIDPNIIKRKAIEKKVISPDSRLSEQEMINLIFNAGFSTKEQVTAISGRGVGMDVVKTNIESLSGEIIVNSVVGKGSEFKISLPLTLAIIDGMTIRLGDKKFVIPLSHVLESVRISHENIKFVTGIGDVLMLRGENLPLISLHSILGIPIAKQLENPIGIIVHVENKAFALLVDDIIARSQVVIKQLGEEVKHLKCFSGSTILGDGRPSLIFEIPEVVLLHKPAKQSVFQDSKVAA